MDEVGQEWRGGAVRSGEDGGVPPGAAHTRAVRKLIAGAKTQEFADLANQLRRCAASVTANILEARGEWPSAIAEVRDLQNQITALLITTIRNLETEKRELLEARKASTSPSS